MIHDSGLPDPVVTSAIQHAIEDLPSDTLVYLLGSRYCETDRLSETAWQLFQNTPPGWARVQAICDFVHRHIAFGYGPHVCLGQYLAKMEVRIFFEELLARVREFELAAEPAWVQANFVSGLKRMPIRYR